MLRRLKLAWRIARGFPYVEAWALLEWTDGDRANLAAFFNSGTGRKLRGTLLNAVTQTALWATNQDGTVRACGRAQGVAMMVAIIEDRFPKPKEEETEESVDVEAILSGKS